MIRTAMIALFAGALLSPQAGRAASPVQMVTFGDSWSDAGMFGEVFGTQPGPAWPGILASALGSPDRPFQQVQIGADHKPVGVPREVGGLNYAEGGAKMGTEDARSDPAIPLSMWAQADRYERERGRFSGNELVLVWGGGNDVVAPFASWGPDSEKAFRTAGAALTASQLAKARDNVRGAALAEIALIRRLVSDGARHIVVIDLIDLGLTPFRPGMSEDSLRLASDLSRLYNRLLWQNLPADPSILRFSAADLFDRVTANPRAYGFEFIRGDGCRDEGYVCSPPGYAAPDADQIFAFAGNGHFTRHTRELVANEVLASVRQRWPGAFPSQDK